MHDFSDCTILIVDDTTTNINILLEGLSNESYDIAVAVDGRGAIDTALNIIPDLILLDIMMPEMDGYEVCKRIKNNPSTANIPIIFLTALDQTKDKTKGFELGCVDYISKSFDIAEVRSRIKTHLELALFRNMLLNQNKTLEDKVKTRTKALEGSNAKLEQSQLEIIMRLGLVTEMRDNDTGDHINRIRSMVEIISLKLGLPEEQCKLYGLASTMHDVGKVGITDSILLKPGKLTDEEFAEIKTHSQIGSKILSRSESALLQTAYIIALHHHEKWNGRGYPNGLSGEAIPLPARITAIADVFDALLSVRPYKQPWPLEKVIALLEKEAGQHFDPKIARVFIDSIPDFPPR